MKPNPAILEAQETALERGALARYNMTRVDLKAFIFSAGSNCRSIDNSVLGPLQKRLLFTMIKNSEFNVSVYINPYKFRHYDVSNFSLYVNGRRVSSEGLPLEMDHEKTCHVV